MKNKNVFACYLNGEKVFKLKFKLKSVQLKIHWL